MADSYIGKTADGGNKKKICGYPACFGQARGATGYCSTHESERVRQAALKAIADRQTCHPDAYHSIYVVGAKELPYVKIGKATNVYKRVSEMQTGMPYKMMIWGVRFAPRGTVTKFELEVHSVAKKLGLHHRGEWFEVGPIDALGIIDKVASLAEVSLMDVGDYWDVRSNSIDSASGIGRPMSATDLNLIQRKVESASKWLT